MHTMQVQVQVQVQACCASTIIVTNVTRDTMQSCQCCCVLCDATTCYHNVCGVGDWWGLGMGIMRSRSSRTSMMLGLGLSAPSTSAGHDNSDSRREGLECRGRREHRQSVGATHSMAMSCSLGNGTYLRLTCPVKLIIMLYRVNNNSYAEPRPCVHG